MINFDLMERRDVDNLKESGKYGHHVATMLKLAKSWFESS